MRRDRLSNEKFVDFVNCVTYTAGITLYSTIFDTMRESISGNTRENHTNVALVITIASGWSATGLLTVKLQHCMDGLAGSMVDYASVALMGGMERKDCYLAEIKDFNRYVRLSILPTTANVTCNIIGSFNRSRREPITQVGTEKAVTYDSQPITY